MNHIIANVKKVVPMLSLVAFDGHIALLAANGLFTIPLAPVHGLSALAGPAALFTAMTLSGTSKEKIVAGLIAGVIATLAIILAALAGDKMHLFFNMRILKIAGGLAILTISLMIFGLKIPSKTPLVMMMGGFMISMIWRTQ